MMNYLTVKMVIWLWTNATERIHIDNAGVAKFQNPTGTLILASTTGNVVVESSSEKTPQMLGVIDSTRANAAFFTQR